MDAVDFQILGYLSREPLATKEALGRSVGLGPSAVRKRLARLADDGVLQGFQATPAADVFGRAAIGVSFEAGLELPPLLLQPDVVSAADSVDGRAGVMGYPHDVEEWVADIQSFVGRTADDVVPVPPRPIAPLGPLELRVLAAMLDDPIGPAAQLGRACGLSPRVAGGKRASLMRGAVDVQPLLRPSRTGATAFHAYLLGEGEALRDAMQVLDEVIEVNRFAGARYVFCRAPSLGEQAARMAAVRNLDGIDRADVVLNRDFLFATDRLKGWIDESLASWRSRSISR